MDFDDDELSEREEEISSSDSDTGKRKSSIGFVKAKMESNNLKRKKKKKIEEEDIIQSNDDDEEEEDDENDMFTFTEEPTSSKTVKKKPTISTDHNKAEARRLLLSLKGSSSTMSFSKINKNNIIVTEEEEDDDGNDSSTVRFPSKTTTPIISNNNNTSGFSQMALKYMQKFNFQGRLGKNEQGIAAPIEVIPRKEGAGLGSVEEASNLPSNRANTEHLERLRLEAVANEENERKRKQEEAELSKIWKRDDSVQKMNEEEEEKSTKEEENPFEGIQRSFDRANLFWKELEEKLEREVSVKQSVNQMKQKENLLGRIEYENNQKRIEILEKLINFLQPLTELNPTLIQSILKEIPLQFSTDVIVDYELNRLPALLVRNSIERTFDENQDLCLDLIEAIHEGCKKWEIEKVDRTLSSTLLKVLVPKLNQIALEWKISSPSLHFIFHPWLPYFNSTVLMNQVLKPPLQALERELLEYDELDNVTFVQSLLQPWAQITNIGRETIREIVGRTLGGKLYDCKNIKVALLWLEQDLLNSSDFACICESSLQQNFVSKSGVFHQYLQDKKYFQAANLYKGIKSTIPYECLKDTCNGGRLRYFFDYALELLKCSMENKSINPFIANSIEPETYTFQDAKRRAAIGGGGKTMEVAADYSSMSNLKQTVESIASSMGKDFHAHPSGKTIDGKRIYVFGETFCYFDRDVIYVSKSSSKHWKPVNLESLLKMN